MARPRFHGYAEERSHGPPGGSYFEQPWASGEGCSYLSSPRPDCARERGQGPPGVLVLEQPPGMAALESAAMLPRGCSYSSSPRHPMKAALSGASKVPWLRSGARPWFPKGLALSYFEQPWASDDPPRLLVL